MSSKWHATGTHHHGRMNAYSTVCFAWYKLPDHADNRRMPVNPEQFTFVWSWQAGFDGLIAQGVLNHTLPVKPCRI
jgi:hypothetical protein